MGHVIQGAFHPWDDSSTERVIQGAYHTRTHDPSKTCRDTLVGDKLFMAACYWNVQERGSGGRRSMRVPARRKNLETIMYIFTYFEMFIFLASQPMPLLCFFPGLVQCNI
jgi:hypothetical protein